MYKAMNVRKLIAGVAIAFCTAVTVPYATLGPTVVQAEEMPTSGKIGDNVTWTLSGDTVTISGTGATYDYAGYHGDDKNFLIHGAGPFERDDRITTIVVKPGITRIGNNLFYGCSSVTSITVPNTVKDFGYGAFSGCNRLENLTMSSFGTAVPKEMFAGCWALKDIPDISKATAIGDYAFQSCGVTNLKIPSGCKKIGAGAFSGSKLESVSLPSSIESISYQAFQACSELKSITIPEGVKSIDPGAFFECTSLRYVSLPSSLEMIGQTAFWGCGSLEEIVIPSGAILEDQTFSQCAKLRKVSIFNDKMTNIMQYTFLGCSSLEEIVIPASINTIEKSAFSECSKLKLVCVNGGNKSAADYRVADGNDAFKNATFRGVNVPEPTPEPAPEPTPDNPTDFRDVKKSDYFYDSVNWAVEKGITNGVGAGVFGPSQACMREQAVTFMWRAKGCPEPTNTNTGFTDVAHGSYYEKAVAWAVENKITNGVSSTKFGVGQPCTREQIVTFLYRYSGEPEVSGTVDFKDMKTSDFSYKAVVWAGQRNITKGTSETEFSPKKKCDRGMIVTFLYRSQNG